MSDRWIASPPSAWADAEREFHLAYLQDPAGPYPRTEVGISWLAHDKEQGLLEQLFEAARGRPTAIDMVAFLLVSTDGRSMSFDAQPEHALAERWGSVHGVLVGGLGSNAIACIEVTGQVIWPMFNPTEENRST